METVLVINSDDYAEDASGTVLTSTADIDKLKDGSCAVITPNGDIIPGTGFGTNESEYFQVVLKTVGGSLLYTPLILREAFDYRKFLHQDVVNKVMTLDFAGAFATGTEGKAAGVTITPGEEVTPLLGKDYENFEVAITASMSVDNAVSQLASLINASSSIVTASASTTVLTLTGKNGEPFSGQGTFEFINYTPAITTSYEAPVADYAEVLAAENTGSAHKGNHNYKSFNQMMYKQPVQANPSIDYAKIQMRFKNRKEDILQSNDEPYLQDCFLYGSDAIIAVLDGILFTA